MCVCVYIHAHTHTHKYIYTYICMYPFLKGLKKLVKQSILMFRLLLDLK